MTTHRPFQLPGQDGGGGLVKRVRAVVVWPDVVGESTGNQFYRAKRAPT